MTNIIKKDLANTNLFYVVKEYVEPLEETIEAWDEYYTNVYNYIFRMDDLIEIWDEQSEKYYGKKTTKETLEKYKWKIFFISAEYCSEEWLDYDYDGIEIKEVFPKEITKTVYVDKKWNEVI